MRQCGLITDCRLDNAHAALTTGAMNIQEASALAGYSSPANFSTAFKRRFGVAPRSVLRTNRGG
ncbi:helix-turn-helix domain-containing protein [Rhizobium sullae]|uniref:helix-turn-helix domain-containing protein n=1 Tax=Rhizobium sullae TaxID=50338 RepID=UPI00246806C9|nr:helix-turn-helix domain-containing protein [Rhizobium sullae]